MDAYSSVDEHTTSQLMLVNTNHTTQFDIPQEQNKKMSSFLAYPNFPNFTYLTYTKNNNFITTIQCYITMADDTAR